MVVHHALQQSPILLAGAKASTAFEGLIDTMIGSNTSGQEINEGFEQDLHRLPSTMGNYCLPWSNSGALISVRS
jgi:hypothetical protein